MAAGALSDALIDVNLPSARRPDASEKVWRDFTLPDLARAYAARSQVHDLQSVFDTWRARTASFVATRRRPALDLVY